MAIQTVQATVNGQTVTLTLNSSTGKYEATLTAPSASSNSLAAGYYPVTVTATDTAGNSTTVDTTDQSFGENLKLYVKEANKPTVTINSPSAEEYATTATPSLSFVVKDNSTQASGYSGFDESAAARWKITLDGTEYNAATASAILNSISEAKTSANAKEYYGQIAVTATFKNLADGNHTISIVATDTDGNTSTAVSRTFTVDTVAPSLTNVTINGDSGSTVTTNDTPIVVSGVTDDVNATAAITLNGTDQGEVTIEQDGSFSKTIALPSDGTYTVVITVTDAAGLLSKATRTVILDTTQPVFRSVVIAPNPATGGNSYTITVEVTD